MRNERKIEMKQNSLPSGIIIKLSLWGALLALGGYFFYQSEISLLAIVGVYFIIRSVLKITRLFIKIVLSILSILSILFLLATTAILITIIF